MSSPSPIRPLAAWFGVLAILLITGWFGWKALWETKPPEVGPGGGGGRPPSTVIVRPAEMQETVEYLPVTGTLRAVRRAEVAARESAAVESIEVNEGDLVQEGELLARLDARRLEALAQEGAAALTSARADLTQREAEHERAQQDEVMMRGLWSERAVAEREYLDSVRELKVAAARENAAREAIAASAKRLEILKVRRDDLRINAPFTGRVVARHTEIGEWLREGDPVVTLVSTGEMEAWLQLPERHVGVLKRTAPESVVLTVRGQTESIRVDTLALVPDVEGRSRSFQLVAHMTDPENALTPGTTVQARVPLGPPTKQLVISSDAVLKGYSGTYVFVPEQAGEGPPMAKRVPVTVLFERDGQSVLAPGALQVGDQVIVEGNERLFPNTPVNPQPWSETRGGGSQSPGPR